MCTAEEDGLQLPFHDDPEGLAAARRRACSDAEGLVVPATVVAIAVQACQVSVPYGIEPGTAIRSTELWAKAFAQVCAPSQSFMLIREQSCADAEWKSMQVK